MLPPPVATRPVTIPPPPRAPTFGEPYLRAALFPVPIDARAASVWRPGATTVRCNKKVEPPK